MNSFRRFFKDKELVSLYLILNQWEQGDESERELAMNFRLLFGVGMRVGELVDLRREDIHEPMLLLRNTKTRAYRWVKAMPELQPHLAADMKIRGREGYFTTFVQRTVRRWWGKLLDAAGIEQGPNEGPHLARRNFICWELARRRLTMEEVRCQVGHSSSEITEKHYSEAITTYMWEPRSPDGDLANLKWPKAAMRGEDDA